MNKEETLSFKKWNINHHVVGKVYELSQDNMNAMIEDLEVLKKENSKLREALKLCASRAGIFNPVEACNKVIKTVENTFKEIDNDRE